jgi:hypothetical protein
LIIVKQGGAAGMVSGKIAQKDDTSTSILRFAIILALV